MIDESPGTYRFLPWLRRGSAAAITTADPLDASPASRATLPVELTVNAEKVPVNTRLYGPGDVVGLDSRQIVKQVGRDGLIRLKLAVVKLL